jgi:argininosuccinate lyase
MQGGVVNQEVTRLWGGRFKGGPSPALARLSKSEPAEWRLAIYDLGGSRAHARELNRAGVLSESELETTLAAITQLEADVKSGAFFWSDDDEDTHTALERALLERLGPLGGKLRAGRSRNDQAVTDLRRYLRDEARGIADGTIQLIRALIAQGREHAETVCCGFTHLQAAQPITYGHHLGAHAQALVRDLDRLRDWDRRTDRCPLGSAALAGSTIAVNPELSARELGFQAPAANSMDAVSDRDHVAELLFVAALLGVHLSRLSEEVCLWITTQFRWVRLDDAYCTGSSIMPQKKNPDIAELTRGASGIFIGNLTSMLVQLKGLPLTYNRDLSWDKHEVLDTVDVLRKVLPAMAGMIATMKINRDVLAASATAGFTLATDVADWLARKGVPFKDAHDIVGNLVRRCEEKGCDLDQLGDAELAAVDARLTPDARTVMDVRHALRSRCGRGATAPDRVREQLDELEKNVEAFAAWSRAEDHRPVD